MGFTNGRWVANGAPNQLEYPFEIAAKLVMNHKVCSLDEIKKFVSDTRTFYDLCKEQDETIRRLEKELKIAEATVRLLQVGDV